MNHSIETTTPQGIAALFHKICYTCQTCQQTWMTLNTIERDCPGAPVYTSLARLPLNLLSKQNLRTLGFKPTGKPAGYLKQEYIRVGSIGGHDFEALYDIRSIKPRRRATPQYGVINGLLEGNP